MAEHLAQAGGDALSLPRTGSLTLIGAPSLPRTGSLTLIGAPSLPQTGSLTPVGAAERPRESLLERPAVRALEVRIDDDDDGGIVGAARPIRPVRCRQAGRAQASGQAARPSKIRFAPGRSPGESAW
jgi:hypothetical protein